MNQLLLKIYLYLFFGITKDNISNKNLLFFHNDFLNLLSQPKPCKINTDSFLHKLEENLNIKITIENKILTEHLFLDNQIIYTCLSLFLKQNSINNNVSFLSYQEKEEVGFLIPTLTAIYGENASNKYVLVNYFLPFPISFLNDIWTSATNGGKIIIEENHIVFKLSGFRIIPSSYKTITDFLEIQDNIELSEEIIKRFISKHNQNKILNLHTVFTNLWEILSTLTHKSNNIEIKIDPNIPFLWAPELTLISIISCLLFPFIIYKNREVGLFSINYEKVSREYNIETIVKTKNPIHTNDELNHIINKLVEQLNGNISINIESKKNEHVFSIKTIVPDTIGIMLDKELDGWEHLSSESIDLLRRLCLQSHIPYEHPFVVEIIRHEIETFFYKVFSTPLFQNLSHDIIEKHKINPEIKPLLEQIKKGKIKKNALEPKAVGNLLEIFLTCSNGAVRIKKSLKISDITFQYLYNLSSALKHFPNSTNNILKSLAIVIKNVNLT